MFCCFMGPLQFDNTDHQAWTAAIETKQRAQSRHIDTLWIKTSILANTSSPRRHLLPVHTGSLHVASPYHKSWNVTGNHHSSYGQQLRTTHAASLRCLEQSTNDNDGQCALRYFARVA